MGDNCMIAVIQKKKVICIALFLLFFGNTEIFADKPFKYVGFASMQIIKTGEKDWDLDFLDLARYSYRMKYTSFKKVAVKLRKKGIFFFFLSIKDKLLLPVNEKELNEFHNNINSAFDKYLEEISIANKTLLIIFDNIEDYRAKKFVTKEQEELYLTVMVYYLDSNSVGMTFVPLDRPLLKNPFELKERIHKAITAALEEAMINAERLINNGINDIQSTPDTPPTNKDYWD